MQAPRIRPIALCVFQHNDELLVMEGYDPSRDLTFYRPLGGGIEFGETSREALIREMREELGAEVTNLRLSGTLENIFTYNNIPGHEIVLYYRGDLVDPAFYARPEIKLDLEGGTGRAVWVPLEAFRRGDFPLYPDGLLEMLDNDEEGKR